MENDLPWPSRRVPPMTDAAFRPIITAPGRCIGHLLKTGRGWRVFNSDDRELGEFQSAADAVAAIGAKQTSDDVKGTHGEAAGRPSITFFGCGRQGVSGQRNPARERSNLTGKGSLPAFLIWPDVRRESIASLLNDQRSKQREVGDGGLCQVAAIAWITHKLNRSFLMTPTCAYRRRCTKFRRESRGQ
jgi:hypothetical protein